MLKPSESFIGTSDYMFCQFHCSLVAVWNPQVMQAIPWLGRWNKTLAFPKSLFVRTLAWDASNHWGTLPPMWKHLPK